MKLIDKDALVAEIERRIEHNTEWKDACKTLAVLAANQAIEEDKKILSIINSLEVKEVQEEHCTEIEFREIEILRTKLSDIAKTIYYHKGKENSTVERIREIVQDCCFELMDLKKPKQEEHASEELEEAIDTYLKSYWGGEKEKQEWPFLKKMAIYFTNWQKKQFEKNRLKHCNSITNEQAELEQEFIDQHLDKHQRMPTFLDAIEYGMRLQREKMINGAVNGLVYTQRTNGEVMFRSNYVKKEGFEFGDKVKMILIKEG